MNEKLFQNKLTLWLADKRVHIEIVLTIVAVVFVSLSMSGNLRDVFLLFTLLTVAGFYFISAYFPAEEANIYTVLAMKVEGVASAVAVMGITFAFFVFEGADQMLLIGLVSLAPLTIFFTYLSLTAPKDKIIMLVVRNFLLIAAAYYFYVR
jgi:hypothetical protein